MAQVNWFKKINAVLRTIGHDFNLVQDKQTYAVMSRAVSELMRNKTIGSPLKEKVIQNIEIRVGPRNIVCDGDIALTKNQRQYARNNGWASLPTFEQLRGNKADDEAPAAEMDLSAFTSVEAEVVRYFIENADAEQRAAFIQFIVAQSQLEGAQEEPEAVKAVVAPDEQVEAVRPVRGHHRDAITIWVKEKNGKVRASGNIEIGGTKYCLTFSDFHSALERLPANDDNASWRAVMAGEIAEAVLPGERNSTGVAACSTMSGLFASSDSFARQPPVFASAAVILEWEEQTPVRGVIIDGDERTAFEINREAADRFKAPVRFAA